MSTTTGFLPPTAAHLHAVNELFHSAAAGAATFMSMAEAEPVDMARLREMVDDDAIGLRELVNLYLVEAQELMGHLRAAVLFGSTTQAEWAAHKLGGASATCGMTGIVAPLRGLERSSRRGGGPEDQQFLREADRQHDRICAYLATHILNS